jgi:acetoin utilization deacetylase AcuC-like enzyme
MTRAALLRSLSFLGHDTGDHVENPGRIRAIERELQRRNAIVGRPDVPFQPLSVDEIGVTHDPRYLVALERYTAMGGGWIDSDTFCGSDSLAVARLAAGAGVAAVDAALHGGVKRAFVLGRPPGHHATAARGMGFCLLNSIAIAANHALANGIERVAIVDWDVHHGNGTQDIFYESDRVLFCSTHRYGGFYPGTGAASERGQGVGLGFTLNVPMRAGDGDRTVTSAFRDVILPAVAAFEPQLMLVSAGFDAHRADPLGGLAMTEQGFYELAAMTVETADRFAEGRLVALLEGGYDPDALGRSVFATIAALDGESFDVYDAST